MRCISAPQMLVGMYLTDDSILNQQADPKGLVLRKEPEDDLITPREAIMGGSRVGTAASGCPAEPARPVLNDPRVHKIPRG